MSDDVTALLTKHGQEIGRDGATVYTALHVVYACEPGGAAALYCAESDWQTTPAARLAEQERQIADLLRKVAALESQLAVRAPVANQTAQFEQQSDYIGAKPDPPPVTVDPCPDCGQAGWKSAKALQMHRQRAHQGMVAIKHPPAQFVEPLGWHCAAKGCTGAHARDMHDPSFCTLHASPRTNGQEARRV